MKRRIKKIICLLCFSLLLTSCTKNPDAASIRQAYIDEEKAKEALANAKGQAEEVKGDLAQAGDDISTAAGIEANNLKKETTTFFEWFFDDINGEWEYMKKVLETPNSEINEVIATKNDYLPGEDEYVLEEPTETGLSYLEKSETAKNAKEALESLQDIEEKTEEKIDNAIDQATDGNSIAGSVIEKAGNAAQDSLNEAKDALSGAKESVNDAKEEIESKYSFPAEPFTGSPYIIINNNKPFFTEEDLSSKEASITLTSLDALGRCGPATELIDYDHLPKEKRGEIGMIKPSGWHQAKYDSLKNDENPAGYLYARCHLLAYCLSGLNAEPRNLITGTLTQFNVVGMEPFELQTLYYVKGTKNHVLYRVTPMFRGTNLIADGVLMEAQSIEDNGLSFCVFVYNVPQLESKVVIDYATGLSASIP